MKEEQLLREVEILQASSARPLRVDTASLLADFREDEEHEGTLGMKVLSLLGAFLATFFFIGFILLVGLYDSLIGLAILGLLLLGVSYWLSATKKRSLLAEAFSVSLSVCGYTMLLIGLSEQLHSVKGLALAGAIIAGLLLLIHENNVVTFLATVACFACLLVLFAEDGKDVFVHVYVAVVALLLTAWFEGEAKLLKASDLVSRRYDGMRAGLVAALLLGVYYLNDFHWWMQGDPQPNWLASLVLIPLTCWVAWRVLRRFVAQPSLRLGYLAGILILLLPTFYAPAICASLLILLLTWKANDRIGAVVAALSLVYFISRYYYDLNLSLLTKSIVLMVSGTLFLVAYSLLYRKIGSQ